MVSSLKTQMVALLNCFIVRMFFGFSNFTHPKNGPRSLQNKGVCLTLFCIAWSGIGSPNLPTVLFEIQKLILRALKGKCFLAFLFESFWMVFIKYLVVYD